MLKLTVRDHTLETLAALMLTMNLASIVVSLASGNARLLFALRPRSPA